MGIPAKRFPAWFFQPQNYLHLSLSIAAVPQTCPAVLPMSFPSPEPQAEVGPLQPGQLWGVRGCFLPLRGKLAELGGKTCPEKEPAFFSYCGCKKAVDLFYQHNTKRADTEALNAQTKGQSISVQRRNSRAVSHVSRGCCSTHLLTNRMQFSKLSF